MLENVKLRSEEEPVKTVRRLNKEAGYFVASNARCNVSAIERHGVQAMLDPEAPLSMRLINDCDDEAKVLARWERVLEAVSFTCIREGDVEVDPLEADRWRRAQSEYLRKQMWKLVRTEPCNVYVGGFFVSKYPELNIVLGSKNAEFDYAVAHFVCVMEEVHLRFKPARNMRKIWAYDVQVTDPLDMMHGTWTDVRAYEYLGHPQPRESLMLAKEYQFGAQNGKDIGADRFVVPVRTLYDKTFPPLVRV